jgi:hypothetical protein
MAGTWPHYNGASRRDSNHQRNADYPGAVLGWEADMPAYCASYNNQHLPPVCNDQVEAASTFGLCVFGKHA